MKKLVFVGVLFAMVVGSIFAQRTPQIAFRLLDDYITEKENSSGARAGGIAGISIGSALIAGSGAAWFFGDDISAAVSEDGQPWDIATKQITTGALAAGGLLSIGTGVVLLVAPPRDYRAEYARVYEEEDPLLREAFSAAALKGLSEDARIKRLLSGWSDLSIPIITVAAQVASNLSGGRLWHEDVFSVSSTQAWQIASGFSEIFFNRSDEEILFEQYESARSAFSVAPVEW